MPAYLLNAYTNKIMETPNELLQEDWFIQFKGIVNLNPVLYSMVFKTRMKRTHPNLNTLPNSNLPPIVKYKIIFSLSHN